MKRLWFLLILIGINLGFAADDITEGPKKLLVIKSLHSDIALNDIEKRMINKVVLKICAKQTDYQIAMGEIGIAREAALSIFEVTLSLTGNDANMSISGILLDEKNKQVVKKVTREKVERLHLMRNIEDVMDGLFPKRVKSQLVK
jgi:hypothetical protein